MPCSSHRGCLHRVVVFLLPLVSMSRQSALVFQGEIASPEVERAVCCKHGVRDNR